MFLSKLKATQDVLVTIILLIIFGIFNADALFSNFRFYKIYFVLRKALFRDCMGAAGISLVCLLLHGQWPDASLPGVLHQFSALAAFLVFGVQTGPMVSCGVFTGGKNQMTKIQLMLRIVAQTTGTVLSFATFGLYYSFALPGEGPFNHFFGLESLVSAGVVLGASVFRMKQQEVAHAAKTH